MAGLAEAQTLLQSFRSERRFRQRVERMLCSRLEEAWPRLLPSLEAGTEEGWARTAETARQLDLGRELEVFDLQGRLLASLPPNPPVGHSFGGIERQTVLEGKPYCIVAETSGDIRVLAYAAFPGSSPQRILRLSREEPDLAEDWSERRLSVMAHRMALGLLVLAGILALWPARPGPGEGSRGALAAYERAMEKLRDRDAELQNQHEAERDRLAAALREREAFSRAGEITAQIVHEVRNGLGTIHGYARLLERQEGPASDRGRLVREECEELEATIRRFVELVRDERPNLAPFDLGRMLVRVAEREARHKGVPTPRVSVPFSLPTLVGDESLLERAFENLVRNALEAAGSSGEVSLAAANNEGTLVVTVCDDGPGLVGGEEPRKLRSTKGGLGIGLSLARKIVTLHDGSLSLLSRVPRGVDAVVALPLMGPRCESDQHAPSQQGCYDR
jgi:signal transduction histidine kinase